MANQREDLDRRRRLTRENTPALRLDVEQLTRVVATPPEPPPPVVPHAVKCVRSTVQAVPDIALTAIDFSDPDAFDEGGLHDAASVTLDVREKIVIQRAGIYQVTGSFWFASGAAALIVAAFTVNGATLVGEGVYEADRAVAMQPRDSLTVVLSLAIGDAVKFLVSHTSGVPRNVQATLAALEVR